MALELRYATPTDASYIADIHMAAFGRNPLLLAQFPTPEIRHQLRSCIAEKAANDIRDLNVIVLVVQDQEGRVVSFAKWSMPVSAKAAAMGLGAEAPWIWPKGTDFGFLDQWSEIAEGAKQKALGDRPAYSKLSFWFSFCRAEASYPSCLFCMSRGYLELVVGGSASFRQHRYL